MVDPEDVEVAPTVSVAHGSLMGGLRSTSLGRVSALVRLALEPLDGGRPAHLQVGRQVEQRLEVVNALQYWTYRYLAWNSSRA